MFLQYSICLLASISSHGQVLSREVYIPLYTVTFNVDMDSKVRIMDLDVWSFSIELLPDSLYDAVFHLQGSIVAVGDVGAVLCGTCDLQGLLRTDVLFPGKGSCSFFKLLV